MFRGREKLPKIEVLVKNRQKCSYFLIGIVLIMIHIFYKLKVKLRGSYFIPISFALMQQYSLLVIFIII